ncbi:hypothetical protein R8Z57_16115 [Microbacterium sp. M3]|uniref:DUF4352 domain-containing protein n=1 Tax=Microbacterium arthrosphaerae TaxID=792652 RepID=A0ABU4H4N5_9MICO|nr:MULTISPECIES: hypothetical protein [Microbacterium]MDW4574306.1 hypothetical protein [Microbacterium arthrosphaerae]MDW7608161.1 hypothetical protein [Microbacterium sp. M3]
MSFDTTQPPSPTGPAVPPPAGPPVNAAPPATTRVHPLGWVALGAAVLGFIFACIPGALFVGWILLPVGFVLGIVAIVLKGKKWPGIVALVLSIVGTIVGFVVFFSLAAAAVSDAIGDSTGTSVTAPSEDAAADEAVEEPAAETGASRDNPAPLGSVISGDEWDVTVNSVTLGATDQVLAANMVNQSPEAGYEYILINVTATYTGADKGMPALTSVNYVTPDGVTIDGLDSFAVAPEPLDTLSELYTGASATGNIALAVPSATADAGVLVVTPGILADDVFVAVK